MKNLLNDHIVKKHKDVLFIEPHPQYLYYDFKEGTTDWCERFIPEDGILDKLELAGRVAYKSEERITSKSAERLVKMLVKSGHHSVLEHFNITVKFVGSRVMAQQLTRHRIAAYTGESQRYCNYGKQGKLYAIIPPQMQEDEYNLYIFMESVQNSYTNYKDFLSDMHTEQARYILPNCTKTEMVTTYNLRQWRNVLKTRIANDSDWEIKLICNKILTEFKRELPVIFGDINVKS